MLVCRKLDGKTHVVAEPDSVNRTLCGLIAGKGIYKSGSDKTNCETCSAVCAMLGRIEYDPDLPMYPEVLEDFNKEVEKIRKLREERELKNG